MRGGLVAYLGWRAFGVAAALWAATVVPGVDIDATSWADRIAALLAGTAAFWLIWGLLEAAGDLFTAVKRRLGLSVKVTFTHSLAFPAFTDASIPLAPGSDITVAEVEGEFEGPAVTSLGRALWQLLKFGIGLTVVVLHFWCSGWLVRRVGLGYEIDGLWPTLGGAAVFNAVYVPLAAIRLRAVPGSDPS